MIVIWPLSTYLIYISKSRPLHNFTKEVMDFVKSYFHFVRITTDIKEGPISFKFQLASGCNQMRTFRSTKSAHVVEPGMWNLKKPGDAK